MSQDINQQAWAVLQGLFSDEGKVNPWPYYARLHELGEVFEAPDGTFFVVGYEEVAHGMPSPTFGKGGGAMADDNGGTYAHCTREQLAQLKDLGSDAAVNIVQLDRPEHTRIRNVVQREFMPKNIRSVEASIPQVIDQLLSKIDPTKPVDIMGSFSAIFAPEIVAELIGLPSDRREQMAELTVSMMRSFDPYLPFDVLLEGAVAGRKHRDYIREVETRRAERPLENDFVTALVQDKELTEPEKTTLLQALYLGGYGTTAHMVGNGLYQLLTNPDQFELLKSDPSLLKPAIEEMLRIDGAIAITSMVALDDAELAGVKIPKGRRVNMMLGAANRDPEAFPDPDRFDIRRKGKPHLSFAGGPHYCLGVNLARLELFEVFKALIERFPNMTLATPTPPRTPTFLQQSYDEVMVLLEPRKVAA